MRAPRRVMLTQPLVRAAPAPRQSTGSRRHYGGAPGILGDTPMPVVGLIAANLLVAGVFALQQGDARVRRFYNNYMILSRSRLRSAGFPYFPLVGHMFTHFDVFHLGANMFTLWSFGGSACSLMGPRRFLALYFTGGIAGGLAHVGYCDAMSRHRYAFPAGGWVRSDGMAVGASGAIMAVTAAMATVRTTALLLYFPCCSAATLLPHIARNSCRC